MARKSDRKGLAVALIARNPAELEAPGKSFDANRFHDEVLTVEAFLGLPQRVLRGVELAHRAAFEEERGWLARSR